MLAWGWICCNGIFTWGGVFVLGGFARGLGEIAAWGCGIAWGGGVFAWGGGGVAWGGGVFARGCGFAWGAGLFACGATTFTLGSLFEFFVAPVICELRAQINVGNIHLFISFPCSSTSFTLLGGSVI